MTDSAAARAKELFLEALELSPDERDERLRSLESTDPELHRRVAGLLRAHSDATEYGLRAVPELLRELKDRTPVAEPDPPLEPGTRLGDYEILDRIGQGGGGTVYRARQLSLERLVALKVLHRARLADRAAVERFRAEAEAIARLDDPNIIPVFEVDERDGRHFFSMKLIEGRSLTDRIGEGPLPPRAAARLLVRIAEAVHHAHQRGFLHCDLKPSNVLLDAAGTPYIADFGIARRLDEGPATEETPAGTPAYMAPEQAGAGSELSIATDVHALGGILFEALSGRPPFEGESVREVLEKVRSEVPRPLVEVGPGIPRELSAIVARCLAKDPDERYPSAYALARDLQSWLDFEPTDALPPGTLERVRLYWMRRPAVANLILLIGFLLLALAVGGTWASIQLSAHLERALEAEQEANERLRASYLAQARSNRLTSLSGRRARSLELLQKAAGIRPGTDLRNEAIACLALSDLSPDAAFQRPEEANGVLAFHSPTQTWAVALEDGRILLHGSDPTRSRRMLDSPGEGPVWHLEFGPRGRYLATKQHPGDAPDRSRAVVWDLETQEVVLDVRALVIGRSLRFSPGGDLVALASDRAELHLYETDGFQEVTRIGLGAVPRDIAFSPDGKSLAVASLDGDWIRIFELPRLVEVRRFEFEEGPFGLSWSPDGGRLVVGCQDHSAFLLDLDGEAPLLRLDGHQAEVVYTFWSPTDELVATYSWDETTRLWSTNTGEELVSVSAKTVGFTHDGAGLSFVTNETMGLFRVDHGEVMHQLHGHEGKSPRVAACSPDGRWLASAGPDALLLWDLRALEQRGSLLETGASDVAFDPRGGRLYATAESNLYRFEFSDDAQDATDFRRSVVRKGDCWNLGVARDGHLVVSGLDVRLFEADRDEPTLTVAGIPRIGSVAILPDASRFAAGTWQGFGCRVWDSATGQVLHDLDPDVRTVSVAFGTAGDLLVTASEERYSFRRSDDAEVVHEADLGSALSQRPGAVAFHPGGERVLLSASHTSVHLRDPRDGAKIAVIEPPGANVISDLDFVPGTDLLVLTMTANRLQVWDLGEVEVALERLGLDAGPRLLPGL